MQNLLEHLREKASKDAGVTARLAELCIRLDSVTVIYRIEAPDIGEYEDLVLYKGMESGVSLVYHDVSKTISLEVPPALATERVRADRANTAK